MDYAWAESQQDAYWEIAIWLVQQIDSNHRAYAPVNVNPGSPPPHPGICVALSPYWQLFESPVCGEFARFVAFVLRNVVH